MINAGTYVGYLGTDAIIQYLEGKDGKKIKKARLFLITDTSVRKEDVNKETGEITVSYENQPKPVPVECWGANADFCEKYAKKGALVIVTGRFEFNEFEHEGKKQSSPFILADTLKIPKTGITEKGKYEAAFKLVNTAVNEGKDIATLKLELQTKLLELIANEG